MPADEFGQKTSGGVRIAVMRQTSSRKNSPPHSTESFEPRASGAVYATIKGAPIWLVLMPVTEQHVYLSIEEQIDEVVIETVWGARRKRGPKL